MSANGLPPPWEKRMATRRQRIDADRAAEQLSATAPNMDVPEVGTDSLNTLVGGQAIPHPQFFYEPWTGEMLSLNHSNNVDPTLGNVVVPPFERRIDAEEQAGGQETTNRRHHQLQSDNLIHSMDNHQVEERPGFESRPQQKTFADQIATHGTAPAPKLAMGSASPASHAPPGITHSDTAHSTPWAVYPPVDLPAAKPPYAPTDEGIAQLTSCSLLDYVRLILKAPATQRVLVEMLATRDKDYPGGIRARATYFFLADWVAEEGDTLPELMQCRLAVLLGISTHGFTIPLPFWKMSRAKSDLVLKLQATHVASHKVDLAAASADIVNRTEALLSSLGTTSNVKRPLQNFDLTITEHYVSTLRMYVAKAWHNDQIYFVHQENVVAFPTLTDMALESALWTWQQITTAAQHDLLMLGWQARLVMAGAASKAHDGPISHAEVLRQVNQQLSSGVPNWPAFFRCRPKAIRQVDMERWGVVYRSFMDELQSAPVPTGRLTRHFDLTTMDETTFPLVLSSAAAALNRHCVIECPTASWANLVNAVMRNPRDPYRFLSWFQNLVLNNRSAQRLPDCGVCLVHNATYTPFTCGHVVYCRRCVERAVQTFRCCPTCACPEIRGEDRQSWKLWI